MAAEEKKPVYTNICIGGPMHGMQHAEKNEVEFFEAARKVAVPKVRIPGDINGAKVDNIRYNKAQFNNPDRVYYFWIFSETTETQGRDGLLGILLDIMTKMQGG